MSILYPVAASADEALQTPRGLAARSRDAADLAGGPVRFISEALGPTFVTREALTEAFRTAVAQPWCAVRPLADGKAKMSVQPVMSEGRRWPAAENHTPVLWRLSVSYWRICGTEQAPDEHARKLRRDPEARTLDAVSLRALVGPAARNEVATAVGYRPI